jgi:hypothetical protein
MMTPKKALNGRRTSSLRAYYLFVEKMMFDFYLTFSTENYSIYIIHYETFKKNPPDKFVLYIYIYEKEDLPLVPTHNSFVITVCNKPNRQDTPSRGIHNLVYRGRRNANKAATRSSCSFLSASIFSSSNADGVAVTVADDNDVVADNFSCCCCCCRW